MKVKYDQLLSNFAFNCNLRHYSMGVVSAHGTDVDAFYDKLLAGESAISKISGWEAPEDLSTAGGPYND